MLSEEEKEARDILVNEIADILVGEYCKQCKICENEDTECYYGKAIDTIDELIKKQQKKLLEIGTILNKYGKKTTEYEPEFYNEIKKVLRDK